MTEFSITLLKAQLFFNIVPIFNLLPPLNNSMHSCPVKVTLLPVRSSAHSILLCLVLTGCLPKGQTVKNLMVWYQEYMWVQQHCPSKFFNGLMDLHTGMWTGIAMEVLHFRHMPCRINSTDLLVFWYSGQSSMLSPEPKIHKWHKFHPKNHSHDFYLLFHGPSWSSAVLDSVSLFILTHHETIVTVAVWANIHE